MKYIVEKIYKRFRSALLGDILVSAKESHDLQLVTLWQQLKSNALNPLNKAGAKYFSQNDEDGITLEILRRIGLKNGVFAEFGVGNGSENNTLVLLAGGWRGFWVGGQNLFFNHESAGPHFSFLKRWVVKDNILICLREGLGLIESAVVDVLSLDLDGNDIYLLEEILRGEVTPKLFIVEYNAKFPPPIRWKMEYDENHKWRCDDYFGASLASFNDLFDGYGYTLICCNFSGINAFFIRDDLLHNFKDIPRDISDLFYGPGYYVHKSYGHKPSPKTVMQFFKGKQ